MTDDPADSDGDKDCDDPAQSPPRFDLAAMATEHAAVFGDAACPQWVKDSLDRYVEHGLPTGDFLLAVLANDLQGACARADAATGRVIAAIVGYVYRHVPHAAHGSYEVAQAYAANQRRLRAAKEAIDRG